MNYLDLIIAIPLLWAAFRGFTRGFIITAASLLALILAIYGGIHFSDVAASMIIAKFGPETRHVQIISFAVTFVAILIIVNLIAWLVDKLVTAVALGFVNRILGIIFNCIKMAFILSVLIAIVNSFNLQNSVIPEKDKEASFLYKPIASVAPALFPYLRFDKLKMKPPGEKAVPRKNDLIT